MTRATAHAAAVAAAVDDAISSAHKPGDIWPSPWRSGPPDHLTPILVSAVEARQADEGLSLFLAFLA